MESDEDTYKQCQHNEIGRLHQDVSIQRTYTQLEQYVREYEP